MLLLELALLAGLSPIDTLLMLFAAVAMVVMSICGGFAHVKEFPWGFFVFSCAFMVFVAYTLFVPGRSLAAQKSNAVGKFFNSLSAFLIILFACYPIAWIFTEGLRKLTVDWEIIIFAVLDVLTIPVFGSWLVFAHEKIPEARFKLNSFWTNGLGSDYDVLDDDS